MKCVFGDQHDGHHWEHARNTEPLMWLALLEQHPYFNKIPMGDGYVDIKFWEALI